ncbi:hypothetical protein GF391_01980 [Candidatus Uhrbacteria bacterium]|nr:hypothetical protein [Candidatus Uhrbacteria bacterium]
MYTIRQTPQIVQANLGIFGPGDIWEYEDFCAEMIMKLLKLIDPEEASRYAFDFENEVFEIHPYWWGDCTCDFRRHETRFRRTHPHAAHCRYKQMRRYIVKSEMLMYCDCHVYNRYCDWLEAEGHHHSPDCRLELPNFRCGDISIYWYKYIGRGMYSESEVTRQELEAMFDRCLDFLQT